VIGPSGTGASVPVARRAYRRGLKDTYVVQMWSVNVGMLTALIPIGIAYLLNWEISRAGDGNRTRVLSLGS